MNLNQIPDEKIVLIDANIFLFANQRASEQCITLLSRCADSSVTGCITTHLLAEITHIFMLAEARDAGLITTGNPARQLSEKPELVRRLYIYESLVRDILSMGLRLEPVQREDFITALSIQRQYGLLTNDALLIAAAARMRITHIASADKILTRVKGIQIYAPDDLTI